jgi:SAM-dependent methyltransferase
MLDSTCITDETHSALPVPGASIDPECPTVAAHSSPDRVGLSDPRRFDRVAAIYQPGEYLAFGPLLERCRFFYLPELAAARRALVLGDGDGRFLARLLAAAPQLHAHAVDGSPAMLRLLRARAARLGAATRLTTACADIRKWPETRSPALAAHLSGEPCDLVATHFFLDCLAPRETEALAVRLRPHLAPGALWVVSEFEVPTAGPLRAALCGLMVAGLYAAFRVLTGLRVLQIPPWRDSLTRTGFVRRSSHSWLGGLLVSELWQLRQATARLRSRSHAEVPIAPELAMPGPLPGIDPGPEPTPGIPPAPEPKPAPGPLPEPDPQPYPGPIPAPQPVTRGMR